ncbi:hypothetical protein TNCV_1793171 [Trichonephila clavipes]|nr:hypothetical protein TNCV_1793171 [Trichonephila clavipes]
MARRDGGQHEKEAQNWGGAGLGAIAYDSRSTLIVIRGILTDQRYVDDILRPHAGPYILTEKFSASERRISLLQPDWLGQGWRTFMDYRAIFF